MIPPCSPRTFDLAGLCLSARRDIHRCEDLPSIFRQRCPLFALAGWTAGRPATSSGLGAELHLQTGVTDDDHQNSTLAVDLQSSVYGTANAVSPDKTTVATFGAGYTLLKTDTRTGVSSYPGGQSFDGGALMIRFEERLFGRHPIRW